MAVRILRRIQAAMDVEEIADYIARDRLEAAIRFLENTEATLRFLANSPGIGNPFKIEHLELANLRTTRVQGFPNHVIFYIEHSDAIEVVRIMHGARDIDAGHRCGTSQ